MKKKLCPLTALVLSIFSFSNLQICKFAFSISKIKNISLRLFFIFAFLHLHISTFAQDSSHIRISLLTCTPGEDLYSTFGHTAFRITDSSSVTDNVFNYGTFNFDDAGFYIKFIRGKLLYYLSVENFADFKSTYQAENRGITEQVLNMNAAEKIAMMRALYENLKDQNKFYQYDFFFDNCTTRPRDMLVKYKQNHPKLKPVMPEGTRFRQAIHEYLDKNNKDWSKLGIDLLLGAPTDAVMTAAHSQFLPDNLMKSLDSSNQHHQMVLSTTSLYRVNREKASRSFHLTPLIFFSILLGVIVALNFSTNGWAKNFLQGFDGVLFFITGAFGILLIFMWLGTDHSMTKNNYNLLWAWPVNIIMAFFVNTKKNWCRKCFGFIALALIIVLLSWFFLPQQMNNALIPLVMLLALRSALKYFPANF